MSRNAESHFSQTPEVDVRRSRFERPFNHKFTFNVGDLVPFFWTPIMPGDTVSMTTSKVVRMSTLLDPVMDNLYLDCYYFFIPWRLVWTHTKEFFGENSSGPWAPSTTYTFPRIKTTGGSGTNDVVRPQTVADYMGIPVGVTNLYFNALPIRSYDLVYDEWFRDQNTQSPGTLYHGDSDVTYSAGSVSEGGIPYKACKLHDFFTAGLPSPQRGPAVQLPLSGTIPVSLGGSVANVTVNATTIHSLGGNLRLQGDSRSSQGTMLETNIADSDGLRETYIGPPTASGKSPITYSNLQVAWPSTVTANLSGASPITVSDLRMAFQMQKWYERAALYGGRYTEYLHAFGVSPPDASLQRSEYLGGNRIPINVQQVEQTAPTTGQSLGHLGAYSATSDVNEDFTRSFSEWGILLGVCCARYTHTYSQGMEKFWSATDRFSVYDPLFANLSNMPIFEKEIYATGTSSDDNVFAYQEAWAEYRYHPDRVSGYMRPGISGSLSSWHYADYYTSAPTLSSGWIQEDKAMVDRTLAVTSATAPQMIADFRCNGVFVRPMPLYSVPGLIDHH